MSRRWIAACAGMLDELVINSVDQWHVETK